jgi:hypothetical protein
MILSWRTMDRIEAFLHECRAASKQSTMLGTPKKPAQGGASRSVGGDGTPLHPALRHAGPYSH